MSRTIRLEDSVYTALEAIRGKRETFSEAVGRLIALLLKVGELKDVVEGAGAYQKGRMEREQKQEFPEGSLLMDLREGKP